MRTNLLEFLFGSEIVRETKDHDLGEQVVKLFEEADKAEGVEMVANKKPLGTALKAIGIDEPVEAGAQEACIQCDDDAEYHEYVRLLHDPDNLTKLAELGWVPAIHGDVAMSNEKPEYRISFIEIQTAEAGDKDKPEDAEKIRKASQKDAASEFERGGKKDENPVELEDPDMGGKREGVGKPTDGKDPEGKPKGSTKKVKESVADQADALLESPTKALTEYGGHYCPKCKKQGNSKPKDGKICCEKCGTEMAYPKSASLRSREAKKNVSEMTSTGAVPAFPSGGNPMSVMSPERRRHAGRAVGKRRQAPPPKPHGASPANS